MYMQLNQSWSPRGHVLGLEAPRGVDSMACPWPCPEAQVLGIGLGGQVLGLGFGSQDLGLVSSGLDYKSELNIRFIKH